MSAVFDLLARGNLRIGLCSRGIARIPNLAAFLDTKNPTFRLGDCGNECDLYIGWGNKKSGHHARQLALESGAEFLLLEDAFFRSLAPQSVNGEAAMGLVLDDLGIYYDASAPSRLEQLIAQASTSQKADQSGAALLELVAEKQISKYNNFDPAAKNVLQDLQKGENVLLVDQTFQDQSIIGAGASDKSFADMFAAAQDENPDANLVVKIHPEVMAGKKRGYLKDIAEKYGCRFLSENINPWQLFSHCNKVYTVSSQLGFEALMAGKQVRCFGMPFYAGWGLTIDEASNARRSPYKPALAQLADAALTQYARYVDPFTGMLTSPEKAIEHLAFARDLYQENTRLKAFYKISGWKKKRIREMFMKPKGKMGKKIFFRSMKAAVKAAKAQEGALVAWASKIDSSLEELCAREKVDLYRLEDGFIRSVGLGANLHLPMSLVLDKQGIYYDASHPSSLETLLETGEFSPALLARARALIETLVTNNISKYNLAAKALDFDLPKDRQIVLVPGQVDNDASVLQSGGGIDSAGLLARARQACPDAFIIFKPHPDVMSGQRPGISRPEDALLHADVFADNAPISALVDCADEVHTLTSLTGFEALQRGKKVVCYGMPFYAGWGLTTDREKHPRRTRRRSLEELVAATLILYPRYYDPVSARPCGPEVIIERILSEIDNPTPPSLLIRARRFQGKIRNKLPWQNKH